MIPEPRGPGDLPVPPEEPRPIARGPGTPSPVLQALEEIEALRKAIDGMAKRIEALERRVAALECPST